MLLPTILQPFAPNHYLEPAPYLSNLLRWPLIPSQTTSLRTPARRTEIRNLP